MRFHRGCGWSGHLRALRIRTMESLTPLGFREKAKILLRFARLPFGKEVEVIGLHIVIVAPESNKVIVFGVMRTCWWWHASDCHLAEIPESQGFSRTVSGLEKTIAENLAES